MAVPAHGPMVSLLGPPRDRETQQASCRHFVLVRLEKSMTQQAEVTFFWDSLAELNPDAIRFDKFDQALVGMIAV